MIVNTLKPPTYPGGQNGWLPLPEGWRVSQHKVDDELSYQVEGPAYFGQIDKRGLVSGGSTDPSDIDILTHEEADALNDIRTWARLGPLQEHRRDRSVNRMMGFIREDEGRLSASCSCGGFWNEDRIGVWVHRVKVGDLARQVDVIEAMEKLS